MQRLADKPFTLLGIDTSDGKRAQCAPRLAAEGVTWRNAIDDERDPTLAECWNVRTVPRLFLLDKQGVIRKRWLGPPPEAELERALDELLKS